MQITSEAIFFQFETQMDNTCESTSQPLCSIMCYYKKQPTLKWLLHLSTSFKYLAVFLAGVVTLSSFEMIRELEAETGDEDQQESGKAVVPNLIKQPAHLEDSQLKLPAQEEERTSKQGQSTIIHNRTIERNVIFSL